MDKSNLFIKPIKPSKKELEFIENREICTKQIEEAFDYIAPPIKVGLDCGHKKKKEK